MAQMKCPKCGAATIPAMGRSYCAQCDWNRDAAERRLVRVQWLVPALIVIFDLMGIIGLGIRDHNWAGAILLATLPVLLLGMVFAGAAQGLRQLRGQSRGRNIGPSAARNAGAAESAIDRKAEKEKFLLSIPPPRPVGLSPRGKTSLTLILFAVFVFEAILIRNLYRVWYSTHSFAGFHGQEIFLACVAVGVATIPFFVRSRMMRDQDLLINGEVAVGRVTDQRRFKNNSAVRYEFQDAAGQTLSGSANDFTRLLDKGMAVFVFYDPQNSKRHIAACGAYFEVVNPRGK
ncbi:MAG: hypothetical protein WAN33_01760 [Candidatus Acidiferrales bacterium]